MNQLIAPDEEGDIKFIVSDGNGGELEVLRFDKGGEIYVKGRYTESDKELVDAFREWALHHIRKG